MSDKLQELAMWLGVTAVGLAAQFGVSVDEARKIAENIIGSMSDYYEVRQKIEDAQKDRESQVTIKGYTFRL